MKIPAIALALAAVLLVIITASIAPARAQHAPANIQAADGSNPGAVTISWDAAADAAFYRIGWVAFDNIAAVQAAGRPWLDAFAFTDVTNYGQTTHTLTDLAPGMQYAFIIGSVSNRFGAAQWSEWAYLTLAEAPATSCPTETGEPPAPQMPTPSPTPTSAPTPTPAHQPTPTGTGNYDSDQDGLIEISNLAQLNAMRYDPNGNGVDPEPIYAAAFPNAMPGMGCPYPGCTGYELISDLDFDTNGNGEADAGDAYWNDGAGWVPIDGDEYAFTADFDGNNHTIANLYINRSDTDYVGLFGSVSGYRSGSSIKRVRLTSANVSGNEYVGGLAGKATGSSIVQVRLESATVSGNQYVGGLAGMCDGGVSISNSYTTGNVSGGNAVGGLVGRYLNGVISGSYSTGSVSGSGAVGGLVGGTYSGSISASYATGNVSGGNAVGGLIGYDNSITAAIIASYATGSVSGSGDYVGGLVGSSEGTISASYATGSVSGGGRAIGGLVGKKVSGSVAASYAVGHVSTSGDTIYVGGLLGYDESGDITASYWDTQTTGQAGSYGGIGKTTAELQSPTGATGIYAHWNPDHWDFGNSTQYPVLKHGSLDPSAQRQ